MVIDSVNYVEETHATLYLGVDFTKEDLEPNILVGKSLWELSSSARNKIALKKGYSCMYFAGFYQPDDNTIRCTFRNPVDSSRIKHKKHNK